MQKFAWQGNNLTSRIRGLQYILPITLVLIVFTYQLIVPQWLSRYYGPRAHEAIDIAFYSLTGPVATWLTLIWIENRLREKDALEQQVYARTRQLSDLTAASPDAIFRLDRAGKIISWNQGAERLFGYPGTEIIGYTLDTLLLDADALRARRRDRGVVQNFEAAARTKSGQRITVEITQTGLFDANEGSSASLLIMRDITARRERETIVEEERSRIARDLHDSIAQTLYFMALKADMARQQVASNPDQTVVELREIGSGLRQAIREVRRTIFALRPLDWSEDGFLDGLRHFVTGMAEHLGWKATLDIDEHNLTITPRCESVVFRLVQESLNNVAKHAGATRVWVRLHPAADSPELVLTVRDDGQGFEVASQPNGGLGLEQMRQRVEALGGGLEIDSQLNAGTTITAYLPQPGS